MAKWDEKAPGGKKTEYLGNHTITTEAGHMVEIDNTPGDRRVKIYHAKGTVIEVHDDGAMITTVKGLTQNFHDKGLEERVKGDFKIIVDGNVDMRVTGNMRHKIDGDYNLDCKNLYVKVGGLESREVVGEQRVQVNGKQTHRVSGDRETITGGGHVESVGGDAKATVTGENTAITGGNGLIMTGGEQTISSGGSMGIGAAEIGIASTGQTTINAVGGNLTLNTGAVGTFEASGKLQQKGSQVSVAGDTYIGQESLGATEGPKIETVGGPADKAFAKV